MVNVPTPPQSQRRRIESLEKEVQDLRKLIYAGNRRPGVVTSNGNVFLAKAVEYSTFPTAGNVFAIKFVDLTFTRSEGTQTPTITERSAAVQDYAYSPSGPVAEGDIVLVERQRNGQYVVVKATTGNHLAYATTAIPARSGTTPGEQTVQPKKLEAGSIVDDGDTLTIYSWVRNDSQANVYIWFEYDVHGTPWFTAEDCP